MSFDCKYNYPQIARDSGFKLRQCRDGLLDWRFIGSLEVEKILREQDFEKIDGALSYLSEAPLAPALEINILDSSVSKYFFISQLAIQYLIFCRKFLDESVKALRLSLVKMEIENEHLKVLNQEYSDETVQLHKKISQFEAKNDIIFPCHICTKNFVSNDALNVHLIRKHSDAPNDLQAMNNDKTLINTIKLELEIKHLKERLNIAEKEIREKSECKKLSPKRCIKISSSTQIDMVNVEIGTQCNLFERKELDSSEDETNMKLFISELQEKLLVLESWKEAHRFENKESIDVIERTLSQVNESLRSRYEQDFKNLKKIIEDAVLPLKPSNEISPTSKKEIQSLLSSAVSDLMQQNSEKLNDILNKIQTIFEEKLLYSQLDISQGNIKMPNIQNISLDPLTVIKNPPNKKTEVKSHRTYNFEEPSRHENQLTDSSLYIPAQVTPLKDSNIENIFNSKTSQTTYTKEMLKQELASFGVVTDTKIIPSCEATNILSHLTKNRNNMQKMNPEFITTRNKLKNFVNNHSIKNPYNGNVHEHSLNAFKSQFINLRNSTSKKDACIGRDPFKERLEKILCSPIKKPSIYSLSYTTDSIRPVPLPRKRVLFHHAIQMTEL